VMKITPTLDLFCRVAPSKNIFHDSDILMNKTSLSDGHVKNFHSSGIKWSTRKLASASPLIAFYETWMI
jgi:hypothetical protein